MTKARSLILLFAFGVGLAGLLAFLGRYEPNLETKRLKNGEFLYLDKINLDSEWSNVCLSTSQELINRALISHDLPDCWQQEQVPIDTLYITFASKKEQCWKFSVDESGPVFGEDETRCFSKQEASSVIITRKGNKVHVESVK
ncbi:hypothetical protein G6N74_28525 [Mesorhizobium sp. CGMCC 1.15528]|uniref:Uncharacterized protein n=1 Tax=Mesorhizobium zhangyense TaxID=1776730 RepID=A0A7C9VDV9_9HYPH|nr:hypothetical protein [Mesorhizobium zhangyense]NGN45006.1 hypothetical protein [Mesorhizobium zhangyense]